MSNSNQDSGIFGAVLALGLLLVIGGGLLAFYQRVVAQRAAAMVAQERQVAELRQAELAAQLAARSVAVSEPAQEPSKSNEEADKPNDNDLVQASIIAKLKAQQADWNKGDLDAFMKVYWNSEKLTFASGGKVTRGYQATLDGYKAKYSTKEKLGTLTFDSLEFQRLAEPVMLVLGTWHLERGDDSVGGNFSLVWQKIEDQWLIVHDHTSALARP